MYQRKITPLIQSLLLATLFSSGLMAAACSAESSNTKILSNQNTAAEIYELGVAYYEGDSVPEDDDKAFEWYTKAADQGLDVAQLNIGGLYENGYGVPQDYDTAFEWYKKAADQGNQEASNRIGRLVMNDKIDDTGITIYSTQETGLTLGDIEDMSQ
ncbi:tetratricopeptide repeat protein [Psychrobacter sp.]|uniref:tetratricopeptide repeat protein n=1 Tax=Psychrobacter sp. TaxID=56811 RepID=UPI00356A122A